MNLWPKDIVNINGKIIEAIAPIIISASRATDIPAFFANSFMESLKVGYLNWTNPFNGKIIPVSLQKVKLIVFWTKNPRPIFPYLPILDEMAIDYYFNYTLNDYENEGLENNLPALKNRLETFMELSEKIGKEKLIWRFDPVLVLKDQSQNLIIEKIVGIAEKIHPYTNKLVFSYVDLNYKKVQHKFNKIGVKVMSLNDTDKLRFAESLSKNMDKFKLQICTCAEHLDFEQFNIKHNKCIDDELIKNIFGDNEILMDFIHSVTIQNKLKDKGQRKFCNCIPSKDIGKYDTCLYNCTYCYAQKNTDRPFKKFDFLEK